MVFIDNSHASKKSLSYIIEFINILFFAIVVYFNINYLFPVYLKERGIGQHVIALLVTSAIISPIKTLIIYLCSSSDPLMQSDVLQSQKIIFLSTFFVAISSTAYCVMDDWLRVRREKKILQNETLQSELRFLKSQINPHFLFNTLNSLYALTLKKSDDAPSIVLRLSEMMRYMLYECNEKRVPLTKEINYLENYLELEKLRLSSSVDLRLNIEGTSDHLLIAPLMFIPFVENGFKHGLHNSINRGFIHIDIKIKDSILKLKVVNNKTDKEERTIEGKKSGGIGLRNVKRRLELLYPNRHSLKISDEEKEYIIKLKLKLHKIKIKNNDKSLIS